MTRSVGEISPLSTSAANEEDGGEREHDAAEDGRANDAASSDFESTARIGDFRRTHACLFRLWFEAAAGGRSRWGCRVRERGEAGHVDRRRRPWVSGVAIAEVVGRGGGLAGVSGALDRRRTAHRRRGRSIVLSLSLYFDRFVLWRGRVVRRQLARGSGICSIFRAQSGELVLQAVRRADCLVPCFGTATRAAPMGPPGT